MAPVAAVVACLAGVAVAAEQGVCDAQVGGKCRNPTQDHLMIQLRQHGSLSTPGEFGCVDMPDVKRGCSADGCKVLAATNGRSCSEYCSSSGRSCKGAWEDTWDDCNVKFPWQCDQPLGGTSDLICECGAEAPVQADTIKTCSGMPDVKRSCSSDGCKVLAATNGRSCSEYCGASGRQCAGAWEEVWDDCKEKFVWNCDQPLGGTSDLICECRDGGAEPVAGSPPEPPAQTQPTKMCTAMPDVKQSCSDSGCKVLAITHGRSCSEYCAASGRRCTGAWEEVWDDCKEKFTWNCDQPLDGTSDLICECDPAVGDVAPVPVQEPPVSVAGGKLVWSEEFDGQQVDESRWSFVHGGGGFGNQERQYYSQRNAVVQKGVLRITARCEEYKGERYTSAKITTRGHAEWGPGHRVEVRARLPQGKGTWPAIWMLPTDNSYGNWPHSGEIDIMEAVGCTRDKVYGTVHTGRYNHMKHTEKFNSLAIGVSEWHSYAIEWKDREIRWFVDGTLFHTFSPSAFDSERWPFDQKFYLILNLAVGGSWGGNCLSGGSPSCSAGDEFGAEQVMEVDFARVYSV